jgi:hypothetical protein
MECGQKGVKRQFLVILVKEVLGGKWKTSGRCAMLSFRDEYCFFFFLRNIFLCGHFNAVLLSEAETCPTKTWAEGLETMYSARQLLLPISELLVSNAEVGRQ